MINTQIITPRRVLLVLLLAIAGSLTGTLVGPQILAAFHGTPAWVLPAILVVSVLLALLATYVAFHLATSEKSNIVNLGPMVRPNNRSSRTRFAGRLNSGVRHRETDRLHE